MNPEQQPIASSEVPPTPEAPRAAQDAPPPQTPPPARDHRWHGGPRVRDDWYADGPPRKSPILAGLLSLVPGLGQIYVGYYGLGFVHAIVVGIIFTLLAMEVAEVMIPMAVLFLVFFMLYNIVDAGRRASLYNQALAGVPGVELPKEAFRLPSAGGSIFGGVLLFGIGFILLLNTAFGVSLLWLEQWWPLLPMIVGGWLVYRAVKERQADT